MSQPITVEEAYKQMMERRKPIRHECSTCLDMPSCWLHDESFALDGVKDCWKPRPVPDYIKNVKI